MSNVPGAGDDAPLCVDLDGTLIRTDLLVESVFALLKRSPAYALLLPVWLLRGRAYFKHRIAGLVDLDVSRIPYHQAFLEYLRAEHHQGRRLVLTTASNGKFARQVAANLGIFHDVFASDESQNLSGERKRDRLRQVFGDKGFDYAANSRVDLAVWSHARRAILVSPAAGVEAAARRLTDVERIFDEKRAGLRGYLRAVRLHQWVKNLLLFVPLVAAHELENPALLGAALLAFMAFGLCASSVYLLNDFLDLASDRAHPRKRERPFASGAISVKIGMALIPLFLALAAIIAMYLPVEFFLLLAVYYAITLAYSFWLKEKVLVDVFVLAVLYTLRLLAGSAAVQIEPSFWLLAFSMFLFLSLAMIKRHSELHGLHERHHDAAIRGRGYHVADMAAIGSLGAASGYLSVLVLALYLNSDDVRVLYSHHEALWLLCPLALYWVSRMWLKSARGEIRDDPIVFAFGDRVSQWLGVMRSEELV